MEEDHIHKKPTNIVHTAHLEGINLVHSITIIFSSHSLRSLSCPLLFYLLLNKTYEYQFLRITVIAIRHVD
jgi:hypothetical protein